MVRDDFAARRDNYRTLLHGLGKTHCDGSSAGGDHKKEGRNDSSVSVSAVSACKGNDKLGICISSECQWMEAVEW